jgi:hypothetical protein
MYLSPLTWGTNDVLADFQHLRDVRTPATNFKAKRVLLAKQRNEEPVFVTFVHKITSIFPPPPYFSNPLAENSSRSRLGQYVEKHFKWDAFPSDVDIGKDLMTYMIILYSINKVHINPFGT